MAQPAADAGRPQIRMDVRIRRFGGTVSATKHDETVEFTDSGAFIFLLIDGSLTAGQLAEALAAEYEISLDLAVEDTTTLLRDLETQGIVEFVTS